MKIQVEYDYWESYLPSRRHRKLRFREVKGITEVTIKEVSKDEAQIAFLVHEILKEKPTEFRIYENKLWKPLMWSERVCGAISLYPVEELVKAVGYYGYYKHLKDKDTAENEKQEFASKHLIVDGIVFKVTGEPRYVINTFGLGHNHGGTGMFVEEYYNSNISHKRYFNALERDKAIAEANRIAEARGDTDDVGKFEGVCNIEVLISDAVSCKPSEEHGDGDPFLNQLDAITATSSLVNEAGFMGLALLMNNTR